MTLPFRRPSRRNFLLGAGFSWLGPRYISIAGIRFRVQKRGTSLWRFLHIHGDETTAREVLQATVERQKATSFFIESEARMVPLDSGRIDPNRMFSWDGAAANLRSLNPEWTGTQMENALRRLDRDREDFVRKILPPRGGILVALHNNSQGYSIRTEIPISEKVSLKSPDTPHEFLLATNPSDFALLAKSQFNCVLQSQPTGPDDGSLSQFCAARRIRYVNIEAALGKREPQQKMLDWILANLPAHSIV